MPALQAARAKRWRVALDDVMKLIIECAQALTLRIGLLSARGD